MNKKRKLLIFYDWFYPGFKAGGPIQSLTNLAIALSSEFEIWVITSAFDLNSDAPLNDIAINKWNTVFLPGSKVPVEVFYALKKTLNKKKVYTLIKEISPSVIYLNGIFSYSFFLLPLFTIKKIHKSIRVVICPRGMLKKGALSGKSFKKKVYITYLKLSRLLNTVYWHATTHEELNDINKHFPDSKGVMAAPNIPKRPSIEVASINKSSGQLRLVYLSLINEHKNLLLLLQVIKEVKAEIALDIYGPVVDEVYWRSCELLIKQMPEKVKYKGHVQPNEVQLVLSQYHTLILLTKGENFGHSIYESMSVGRPVITSTFTPWQNLYEKRAGANANIKDLNDCVMKINLFAQMDQEEYQVYCAGAYDVAVEYYTNLNSIERYSKLFSMM